MRANSPGKGSGILESTTLRKGWSYRVQAVPELVRSLTAAGGEEQRVEGGKHLPACGMRTRGRVQGLPLCKRGLENRREVERGEKSLKCLIRDKRAVQVGSMHVLLPEEKHWELTGLLSASEGRMKN